MNCPQHNHNQQGSVALIMVIVLATMGLLLLKNLHHYQNRMLLTLAKEQRYFQAFNQAESALAWGKTVDWKIDIPDATSWLCTQQPQNNNQSCLLYVPKKGFLLAGKGQFDPQTNLVVYQWMQKSDSLSMRLTPIKQGWLDYCPLNKKRLCL